MSKMKPEKKKDLNKKGTKSWFVWSEAVQKRSRRLRERKS